MNDTGDICRRGCAPVCVLCKRTKAPLGRSIAPAANGTHCDFQRWGYYDKPSPCDLWPCEERDEEPAVMVVK